MIKVSDLVMHFESLGHHCGFGLFQRRSGLVRSLDIARGDCKTVRHSGSWRGHSEPRDGHCLIVGMTSASPAISGYALPHGFSPGTVYVASTFIYIPAAADLDAVSVVMGGYASRWIHI